MKSTIFFILLSCLLLSAIVDLNAQVERTYKPRQVINVGEGKKVEILRCRGEGPLEECDVIYYTTRRQDGVRMWQNTNRLREEEHAASMLKGWSGQEARKNPISNVLLSSQAAINDSLNRTVKKYQKSTAEFNSIVSHADSLAAGNKQVVLQREAKRLDSSSRAATDTFKLSLQRDLQWQDSLEKAIENEKEAQEQKKQDTATGNSVIEFKRGAFYVGTINLYKAGRNSQANDSEGLPLQRLVISELLTKNAVSSIVNCDNLRQKINFAVLL